MKSLASIAPTAISSRRSISYIAEPERLLDEVAREDRGRRRCAATSAPRPAPCSIPCRARRGRLG